MTLLELLPKGTLERPAGRFLCSCGKEKIAMLKAVKGGSLKSCGCLGGEQPKIGEKHNKLTLIEIVNGIKKWQTFGKFRCECGNEITTLLCSVRLNKTKSCGCANGLPAGEAALNGLYSTYRFQASRFKDVPFELTRDEFRKLTSSDCYYCGTPPSRHYKHSRKGKTPYLSNGVDRVNNLLGYTLKNSVPCCGTCNHAKATMTQEEFLSWAHRLVNYQNNKLKLIKIHTA